MNGAGEDKPPPELISHRVSWGRLALIVSLLPLVPFVWILYFLFPAVGLFAIGLALFGWKRPGSLVHGPRRLSAGLAILIGAIQTSLWGWFLWFIWHNLTGIRG